MSSVLGGKAEDFLTAEIARWDEEYLRANVQGSALSHFLDHAKRFVNQLVYLHWPVLQVGNPDVHVSIDVSRALVPHVLPPLIEIRMWLVLQCCQAGCALETFITPMVKNTEIGLTVLVLYARNEEQFPKSAIIVHHHLGEQTLDFTSAADGLEQDSDLSQEGCEVQQCGWLHPGLDGRPESEQRCPQLQALDKRLRAEAGSDHRGWTRADRMLAISDRLTKQKHLDMRNFLDKQLRVDAARRRSP